MYDHSNPHNIRSDIPFTGEGIRKKAANYPWETLEVGQSFFVSSVTTARNGVSRQRYERPLKAFAYRPSQEEVNGELVNGARVWRLEDRTKEEARRWFEDRGKLPPFGFDD